MTCKYLSDEFTAVCTNTDCPCCADFCPCLNYSEICKYAEEKEMSDCCMCHHAILDYSEYYGTKDKEWFVCGCKKDMEPDDCNEYEEVEMEI